MSEITTLSQLLDGSHAIAPGDAEAITDGRTRWSWDEYRDQVARIAAILIDVGVEPGDRVGVHLAKSPFSFAAVHGTLRAGAVMVPLDALAPAAATNAVLIDAGQRGGKWAFHVNHAPMRLTARKP